MVNRAFLKYLIDMERRLKLNALNIEKGKEDYKTYRLRRDNKRGIRYVERDERIRQKYFRVWPKEKTARQNIYALVNIAFVLELQGRNIGVKGWFLNTRDDPFGIHGVVEGTKTQFKRFLDFLEDWKDEDVVDCYVRGKPGYIKQYTFDYLGYIETPTEYHYTPVEEKIVPPMFSGRLDTY